MRDVRRDNSLYRVTVVVLLLLSLLWFTQAAAASDRVALVIGNAAYDHAPLRNPVNDASDIASALRAQGFTRIIEISDADLNGMRRALRDFREALVGAELGLFYFAGHGAQFQGENYLIPVGSRIDAALDLDIEALGAQQVLRQMEGAGSRVNVVILDACRDNPYPAAARSGNRGLARVESVTGGSLIAFATAPGQVADDGAGRNSPYTAALLRHLGEPVSLPELFNRVGFAVTESTRGRQVPWYQASPLPPIQLAAVSVVTPPEPEPEPEPPESPASVRLSVKATPADAQIRIMNIVPAYEDGIALDSGRYDIEVSASGYQTHRRWYALSAGDRVIEVALERLPEPTATGTVSRDRLQDGTPGPEMVLIRGGTFTMGSPASEAGRNPRRDGDRERQHRVRVEDVWIGQHAVTVGEFRHFVAASGYRTDAERRGCWTWADGRWLLRGGRSWRNPGFDQSDAHPVVCVSWNDVQAYVQWLSTQTGQSYRLPTEAEWEYAARAGTTTARYWGDDIGRNQANCRGCGSRWDGRQTAPVGSFAPNPWGLYDMLGNVWEWTCSAFDAGYGGAEQRCDARGERRAVRGGSWNNDPDWVRSADRDLLTPGYRDNYQGFRLARSP